MKEEADKGRTKKESLNQDLTQTATKNKPNCQITNIVSLLTKFILITTINNCAIYILHTIC